MTNPKKDKIVFLGSSQTFSVPILKKLVSKNYSIAYVVTQPDKQRGRGKKTGSTDIKQYACAMGIPVLQPQNFKEAKIIDILRSARADAFVMASYGKFLPQNILNIPDHGIINIHPSLLPKYRGPSPIQTQILDGEKESGITLIVTDEEMDHGPIVAQRINAIFPQDDNLSLTTRLASEAAELLAETLPHYLAGNITPKDQNHEKATYTKLIKKEHARVNWNKSADQIERGVRAYTGWPVSWTLLGNIKIQILKARAAAPADNKHPGTFFITKSGELAVSCKNSRLILEQVKPEGKKAMNGAGFINGYGNLLPQ